MSGGGGNKNKIPVRLTVIQPHKCRHAHAAQTQAQDSSACATGNTKCKRHKAAMRTKECHDIILIMPNYIIIIMVLHHNNGNSCCPKSVGDRAETTMPLTGAYTLTFIVEAILLGHQ